MGNPLCTKVVLMSKGVGAAVSELRLFCSAPCRPAALPAARRLSPARCALAPRRCAVRRRSLSPQPPHYNYR